MSTVLNVLTLASFLILINERITEFVYKPLIRDLVRLAGKSEALASGLVPYVAAASAMVIVVGFQIDIFRAWSVMVGIDPLPPNWATMALTAIVVAGGSNLLSDIWGRIVGGVPQPAKAAALPEGQAAVAEALPVFNSDYETAQAAVAQQAAAVWAGDPTASAGEGDQWLIRVGLEIAARLGNGNAEAGLKRLVIWHYRHSNGGGQ